LSQSLTLVTSRSNPRLKLARSLGGSSGIRKHGVFLMEGPRFINDYLSAGSNQPEFVLMSSECSKEALATAERISDIGTEILCIPKELFRELTDTEHSQGIAAVCRLPENSMDEVMSGGAVLMLDRISDPGNVGTAIRSAAAFGCGGVVCGKGTCFPFLPRVTRAAAGHNAAIPMVYGVDTGDTVREFSKAGYAILAADTGGKPAGELQVPYDRRFVILVGSEAHGLAEAVVSLADEIVTIPMPGGIDSLNAGVAASILLFCLLKNQSEESNQLAD
jgi:TrmH family RNA methyltransferase